MSDENKSTIAAMVRAKSLLQNRASDPDFVNIVSLIEKYINDHCAHHIIYDTIDITPDTSKTIQYCTECYTDFPHPS